MADFELQVVVQHLHSTEILIYVFVNFVFILLFPVANERKTVPEPVRGTEGNMLYFRKKEEL